jgi:glycine oxidase
VLRHGGAQIFPGQFTATLLEAAGATVVADDVRGLAIEDQRVVGVQLRRGELKADAVVLAMGPWTAEASGWLGMPIPVTPLKGQILHLELEAAPAGGFTALDGSYLVRKPGGVVYAGTTEEHAGFDETPTAEAEQAILAWARASSPLVGQAGVVERTACLRPMTPDGNPILGKVPGLQGLYVATGHGRKGILLSLASGKMLTELVLDGRAGSADPTPFAPGRFGAGVPA